MDLSVADDIAAMPGVAAVAPQVQVPFEEAQISGFGMPKIITGGVAGTCTVLINVGFGTATTTVGSLSFPVSASAPTTPTQPTQGATGGATGAAYAYNTPINLATYVPGPTGQAVPSVSGCTAPDPTTRMAGLPYPNGPYLGPPSSTLTAGSGVVTSFPLYGLAQFGRTALQVAFGEVSGASAAGTIDISISPCPGVINTSVNDACNIHGIGITNGATFGWANNSSTAAQNLECYAPEDSQRYYNVRWNYPASNCASGNNCGWSVNVN